MSLFGKKQKKPFDFQYRGSKSRKSKQGRVKLLSWACECSQNLITTSYRSLLPLQKVNPQIYSAESKALTLIP
ncbi:hypothetical protein PRUPE_6G328800 [Prunus persica]|uniref:Uncharacterized protein n=1 Tax=Prunus persica TaxID=3760 RepID=A0A251NZ19_PRUPE|nr:hypothetical protein PRUPE_6G328800 [Prunus persica]